MASILISGHKGFIGQHLHKALKDEHEVVGLDLYGYEPKPLDAYDGIIHLAAVSRVKEAQRDPVACMGTNIIETVKMMQLPHKWFILASSCEEPRNVYGLSKRCAEDYVKIAGDMYIILRLSNVYGPGMQEDKLLPLLRNAVVAAINPDTLPFEHIHVDEVVAQIKTLIPTFANAHFKPYTLKLANGIARTPQELLDVAASY